jgi:hypothetical protein
MIVIWILLSIGILLGHDFIARFPYDWDVVQIAIICTGDIHVVNS